MNKTAGSDRLYLFQKFQNRGAVECGNISSMVTAFQTAILLSLLCCAGAHAADELSGKWTGTWTDKRPNSGNSGGPLWADATQEKVDVWKFIFRIDSKRKYEILFKGKRENGELKFSGFADANDARGLYYWTARLTDKGLTGTYEGVEERGVFVLSRDVESEKKGDAK